MDLSGDQAIIDGFLYCDNAGNIEATDGTTPCNVDIDFVAGTTYRIMLRWGYDDLGEKYQVGVDDTWGDEQDFDGDFTDDGTLSWFPSSTIPQSIRNVVFLDRDFAATTIRYDGLNITPDNPDTVSNNSLTTAIAGSRYGVDSGTGVYGSAASNVAYVDSVKGLRVGTPAVENLFSNPDSPETQSLALSAGTFTMSCAGTGSVDWDGNTASDGSHVTFTTAGATNDATVTGDLDWFQITESEYELATNLSGSITVTEAGDTDQGCYLDNLSTDFAAFYDILDDGEGYAKIHWQAP